jgi:NhaP-type Na+/H+ or K+/H+ antiporter
MRIVLAIGLFAIGVELPKAYLAKHVRSLLVMVVPTMAFGWLVCGGNVSALQLLPSSYAGRLTLH